MAKCKVNITNNSLSTTVTKDVKLFVNIFGMDLMQMPQR